MRGRWEGEIMSATKLKRQLREALRIWQKQKRSPDVEGLAGFTPGVLKGFEESLRIVEEFHRQELCKTVTERRAMTRWSAVDLYRACRRAYGRLRYSDRIGAIRALKRALDQTKP